MLSVPVVFEHLPDDESYSQALDALQNLSTVFDSVLNRVSSRVTAEKSRVDSIRLRLQFAEDKIRQVSSGSLAVTVLSPATLPAPARLTEPAPLFAAASRRPPEHSSGARRNDDYQRPQASMRSVDPATAMSVPPALSAAERGAEHSPLDAYVDGLGRVPEGLESVSSLLLFNSPFSPYRHYRGVNLVGRDRMRKLGGMRRPYEPDPVPRLAAAPSSLSDATEATAAAVTDRLEYRPVLGAVPSLTDLPRVLPRLSHVSEPLWSPEAAALQPIAPSACFAVPYLPPLLAAEDPVDSSGVSAFFLQPPPPPPPPSMPSSAFPSPVAAETPERQLTMDQHRQAQQPLPLQQPPPWQQQQQSVPSTAVAHDLRAYQIPAAAVTPAATAAPPAPPPPPPPPPLSPPPPTARVQERERPRATVQRAAEQTPDGTADGGSGFDRDAVMDSIRQGVQLRPAAERKLRPRRGDQMDIWATLRSAIDGRQRNMSGENERRADIDDSPIAVPDGADDDWVD